MCSKHEVVANVYVQMFMLSMKLKSALSGMEANV